MGLISVKLIRRAVLFSAAFFVFSSATHVVASTADWSIYDPLTTDVSTRLNRANDEGQGPPPAHAQGKQKKSKAKQNHTIKVDPEFLPLNLEDIYR